MNSPTLRRARWMGALLWPCLVLAASPYPDMEARLAQLRGDPPALYAFLLRMPKGGDLHNHLTGAVYAESYIDAAAEDGLCANLRAGSLVFPNPGGGCGEGEVPAARAAADNTLRNALIDSLSMRNFVPGRESAHDHFFGVFAKFNAVKPEHRGAFLAEMTRRAAEQNESYLEVMAINGKPVNALADRIGWSDDFEFTQQQLLAGGLDSVVGQLRARIGDIDKARRMALGCDKEPHAPACRVVVRYVFEVLRESPRQQVFAEALAGFRLATVEPLVVGVNFVQAEDGVISMRDYHLHMRIMQHLRQTYPKVHVSLHAGELGPGLVPPEGLRFHIREAVEIAGAERIGHGADLGYENDSQGLLALMRQNHVMVEINLTSNDLILGVRGQDHPLPEYLKAGVPVAISTDDEGVSRTHLTQEFLRAELTYKLSYADLKEMVRNSLKYAFVEEAEKARLESDLEEKLREFEVSAVHSLSRR
ncbi:MAG: adenosine deaminase [Bryobacteraceae bacterium]